MRKFVVISFVILGVVYVGGAVCSLFKVIDWNTYLIIAAIVGGLASILGLGAASMRSELREYSADALKQLAKTANEIENKRTELKDTTDQIASLEYRKEELEVLVKKASLSLYYREECDRLYQKLLDLLHKDNELSEVIVSIQQMESDLVALDGEINENQEIKDILLTIQKAKNKKATNMFFRNASSSFFNILYRRLL